jgi:hypothetical protein
MKYDVLGIPLGSSQPSEVQRVADELRHWLNERHERGYTFVCGIAGIYSTIVIVCQQEHDPMEHGD